MPSPFPGMDPYIEGWIWGDFHASMIHAIREYANQRLPKRYVASTELYVWREDPPESRVLLGEPDVYFSDQSRTDLSGPAIATLTAPHTAILPGVEKKQRYLKIIDQERRRVVTVLEILSPSNKTGKNGGEMYRLKRDEYLASDISLVELDLLRCGMRPQLGDPPPPPGDYYVMVSRAWEHPRLAIWTFSIRDAFPLVPIPLDIQVGEVLLDLRACMDRCYDGGRYGEQLDYSKALRPPLREPDATWACELLAARDKRITT